MHYRSYRTLAHDVAIWSGALPWADVYERTQAVLFIESSTHQSREIARRTGWPVLCTRTGELALHAPAVRQARRARRFLGRALRRVTKPWRG